MSSVENILKAKPIRRTEETLLDFSKPLESPKPNKKYDSVVLRLTDENKQLRELVEQLTEQNAALATQLKIQ